MGYRNYSVANGFTVDKLGNGDFTTIGAALAAAVSGDTIFIRDGVYTENPALKAGVDVVGFIGDGFEANVTIVGKCTFSSVGFVNISGIRLQTNSDFCLVVSGSSASIVFLTDCYIFASNNTAISFTSSSVNSAIEIIGCQGNTGTTGVTFYSHTATGQLTINTTSFGNSGASSTASNCTGGTNISYSGFSIPISTSGAGAYNIAYSNFNTSTQNVAAFTLVGTGSSFIEYSDFISGTASAIAVGTGTTLDVLNTCSINSTNTNAITGLGTIKYGLIVYNGSSSLNNVTTQSTYATQPALGGFVVQQIRASTTTPGSTATTFSIGAVPTNSGGVQILTATITPQSASHVLLIEYSLWINIANNTTGVQTQSSVSALFQGAIVNAIYAQQDNISADSLALSSNVRNSGGMISGRFYMAAGTTSATAFNLRIGLESTNSGSSTLYYLQNAAGSTYGGAQFASLTITEMTS